MGCQIILQKYVKVVICVFIYVRTWQVLQENNVHGHSQYLALNQCLFFLKVI